VQVRVLPGAPKQLTKPKRDCIIIVMNKIKVIWKDHANLACEKEFDDLTPAMDWAKVLNEFVTIKTDAYEIVGKFGSDSIEDGKCPDGEDYSWKKRRI
jgi:hypothetical protein